MNPSIATPPFLPQGGDVQPQAPANPLALILQAQQAQAAQAPTPADSPLAQYIRALRSQGLSEPEIDPLARMNADADESAKKASKQNTLAQDMLMGAVRGGQRPEDLTKGGIARNALANFARGVLMGPNFVSAQAEERDRRIRELSLAAQAARLQETEAKNRQMEARMNIQNAMMNMSRQAELQRRTQADQWRYELGQGRLDLGYANLDDKKEMEEWTQRFKTLQLEGKAPKSPTELAYYISQHPDQADNMLKLWGRVQEEEKKSKYAPTGGSQGPILMIPNANGSFTAQRVAPGQTVEPGAVTPGGLSSLSVPTMNTRAMAEKAPRVINFVDRMGEILDENEKQLGPLASRWNEFTSGKIGLKNKGFIQLRTNARLLQTALMQMHTGSRGSDMMLQHFHDLINESIQDPENLRTVLAEVKRYAQEVAGEGGPKTGEAQNPNASRTPPPPPPPGKPKATSGAVLPGNISLADIDAELARRKGKK